MINSIRQCLFFKVVVPIYTSITNGIMVSLLCILINTWSHQLSKFLPIWQLEVVSDCGFKFHSLDYNEMEHVFMFIGHLSFLFYKASTEVFLTLICTHSSYIPRKAILCQFNVLHLPSLSSWLVFYPFYKCYRLTVLRYTLRSSIPGFKSWLYDLIAIWP